MPENSESQPNNTRKWQSRMESLFPQLTPEQRIGAASQQLDRQHLLLNVNEKTLEGLRKLRNFIESYKNKNGTIDFQKLPKNHTTPIRQLPNQKRLTANHKL